MHVDRFDDLGALLGKGKKGRTYSIVVLAFFSVVFFGTGTLFGTFLRLGRGSGNGRAGPSSQPADEYEYNVSFFFLIGKLSVVS
jgi:hypothetical protein